MLDSSRVRALATKDLREALANRTVLVSTLLLPLVVCTAMPLLTIAGGAAGQGGMKLDPADAAKLFALYAIPAELTATQDRTLYVFLNHTFVPLFLVLPLMVSTIFATHAVVGEKERRTLETLLQTPLRAGELVAAKILGAFLPAVAVALLSFALFAASSSLAGAAFTRPVLLSAAMWVPVVLLLSPAVSLAALTISLVVSLRAKTFVEAQQIAGVTVVPLVGTMIAAASGRIAVGPQAVLTSAVVILAVTLVALARIASRLDRERLIRTI